MYPNNTNFNQNLYPKSLFRRKKPELQNEIFLKCVLEKGNCVS